MTQYKELKKIVGSISVDKMHCGSALFFHSADGKTDYCITAYHCIFNNETEEQYRFEVNLSNTVLPVDSFERIVYDSEKDIAILKLNEHLEYPDVQSIIPISNGKYKLIGYPEKTQGNTATELISLNARPSTFDEGKYCFNLDDIANNDKLEHIMGFSGGGVFEENSNGLFFVGLEIEALNSDVDYNLISCVPKIEIDHLLAENEMPPLTVTVPRFTLNCGKYTVISEALGQCSFQNAMVKNTNSDLVIKRIKQYCSDYSKTALFICGQSGIGKTRSVLETCAEIDEYAVYFAEKPEEDTLRQICAQSEGHIIIVDEADIDFWNDTNNRILSNLSAKIIIIGTVRNSANTGYSDNVLRLAPPTDCDVLDILKASYEEFSKSEYEGIIKLSRSDLRLALLISDIHSHNRLELSSHSSSALINKYNSAEKILNKRLKMLGNANPDLARLTEIYQKLSVSIDIGFIKTKECELKAVAELFGDDVNEYLQAIDIFTDAGLGIKKGFFFEESPRALSKLAFEQGGWEKIKYTLSAFLEKIPNSQLLQRFLERTRECGSVDDSEVARYFLNKFPTRRLSSINYQNYETIALYIEYFPKEGLDWLSEAVLYSDCSRFSGTARQRIVWVCGNLSYFSDFFYTCEEILFTLAQNETEKYRNNSCGTWASLFAIIAPSSCISFSERYKLLLKRAAECHGSNGCTMLHQAFEEIICLSRSHFGPPKNVGGVITPKPFMPATYGELSNLICYALSELANIFGSLSEEIKITLTECLILGVTKCLNTRILPTYRKALNTIIDDGDNHKYILINKLYRILRHKDISQNKDLSEMLNDWLSDLRDTSLGGKLKELFHREYWLFGNSENVDEVREQYIDSIAKQFFESGIDMPYDFIDSNCDFWLIQEFAHHLAKYDDLLKFYNPEDFTKDELTYCFAKGYLQGIADKNGSLPNSIYCDIDNLKAQNTERSIELSAIFDISQRGFDRIVSLISATENHLCALCLCSKSWNDYLSEDQMLTIIKTFASCKNGFEMLAEIYTSWCRNGIATDKIHNLFIDIIEKGDFSLEENSWELIFLAIKKAKPEIAFRFLKVMIPHFDFNKSMYGINGNIIQLMSLCLSPTNEKEIMNAIGKLLIKSRETTFVWEALHGFFERFSAETVMEWINEDAEIRAPMVAYHLLMPSIHSPECSLLTDRFLRSFSNYTNVEYELYHGQFYNISYSPSEIYSHKEEWLSLAEHHSHSSNILLRKWAIKKKSWLIDLIEEEETMIAEGKRFSEN